MRMLPVFLCLFPFAAHAQSAWEALDTGGKTIARICDPAADDTCVVVFCDESETQPSIAFVRPDAWSVQAGSKEDLFLQIGNGAQQRIEGEIASAPGFDLQFFAVAGALSSAQLSGLRAGSAFTISRPNGDTATLPLAGSSAAISRALAPSCG